MPYFNLVVLILPYSIEFRESLRISVTNLHEAITPTEEKDRFKKFQEAEKKRYRAEQQRYLPFLCIFVHDLHL